MQTEGVFNNGNADLKEIASYFEKILNIDLGQFNRVFLEIRIRKSSQTKFLDSLKEALLKLMNNADEK